jgi:hypothetical protein
MLQVLRLPRQYVQLHRDTTVQELTARLELVGGKLELRDAPLVVAARRGHVLVVDEADKAPAHVLAYLKSLAAEGAMLLADGRRIVPPTHGVGEEQEHEEEEEEEEEEGGKSGGAPPAVDSTSERIPLHADFRLIVLANRPGYPFLGQDFFGEVGDAFAPHAIENPDIESSLALLRGWGQKRAKKQSKSTAAAAGGGVGGGVGGGSGVDDEDEGSSDSDEGISLPTPVLRRLAAAFDELRALSAAGRLSYPYSTRELVHAVRHLRRFPDDGAAGALANVLDFDRGQPLERALVATVLARHGIHTADGDADAADDRYLPTDGGGGGEQQRLPRRVDPRIVLAPQVSLKHAPHLAQRWREGGAAAAGGATAGGGPGAGVGRAAGAEALLLPSFEFPLPYRRNPLLGCTAGGDPSNSSASNSSASSSSSSSSSGAGEGEGGGGAVEWALGVPLQPSACWPVRWASARTSRFGELSCSARLTAGAPGSPLTEGGDGGVAGYGGGNGAVRLGAASYVLGATVVPPPPATTPAHQQQQQQQQQQPPQLVTLFRTPNELVLVACDAPAIEEWGQGASESAAANDAAAMDELIRERTKQTAATAAAAAAAAAQAAAAPASNTPSPPPPFVAAAVADTAATVYGGSPQYPKWQSPPPTDAAQAAALLYADEADAALDATADSEASYLPATATNARAFALLGAVPPFHAPLPPRRCWLEQTEVGGGGFRGGGGGAGAAAPKQVVAVHAESGEHTFIVDVAPPAGHLAGVRGAAAATAAEAAAELDAELAAGTGKHERKIDPAAARAVRMASLATASAMTTRADDAPARMRALVLAPLLRHGAALATAEEGASLLPGNSLLLCRSSRLTRD